LEQLCTDLSASLSFYVGTCGFQLRYARPEDSFTYLERDGAELMLEQLAGSSATSIVVRRGV
jgi:hypothetical protein